MPPSRAFEEDVLLDGDVLIVLGQSDILDGCELVSRHVIIGQNAQIGENVPPAPPAPPAPDEEGPAPPPPGKGWRAEVPSDGFVTGAATALGIETHSMADGVSPGLPLLMTFSWTQHLTIKTA